MWKHKQLTLYFDFAVSTDPAVKDSETHNYIGKTIKGTSSQATALTESCSI